MKTSLFILGHLLRHGPLHGYKLKSLIDDGASEFAKIKLPTLYYHLEQLGRKGYLTGESEQHGRRPERQVYTISEAGEKQFIKLMEKALAKDYEAEFLLDAVFYFGEAIPLDKLLSRLRNKKSFLENAHAELLENRDELLDRFSGTNDAMAKAIFRHQQTHYEAEIKWLEETISEFEKS